MQFQKIVLLGTIVSKPEIMKHETDIKQDCMKFELSVSFILASKVVFPIVIFGPLAEMWEEHISEGKQVLVEGRVYVDNEGKWIVSADWVQGEEEVKEGNSNKGKE